MSLREIVDALVASEPFERLLLERARPIVARAQARRGPGGGRAWRRRSTLPVLAVTPGPREAEALAADLVAYLGADAVALLPAWEALPYEGISPAPEVAARRAERRSSGCARPTARSSWSPPPSRRCRGVIPTLGHDRVARARGRARAPARRARRPAGGPRATRAPTSSSTAGSSRCAAASSTSSRGPRAGRCAWSTGATRSSRCASSSPSTQLSTEKVARVDVPPVRELIPDDALRARAGEVAAAHADRFADQLQRLADGLFVEGAETLAPFLFDHLPTPAELLPDGAWVVVTQAHRTLDRARAGHRRGRGARRGDRVARPPARCTRSRMRWAAACSCASRSSPRAWTSGWSTGGRRRGTPASSRSACASSRGADTGSCSPPAGTGRSRA